ncbi:fused MFS/spermidine synthase [Candidatus Woesearchaeota archaeon]|nr:fused MFS/spermidine synthase [Candidatus Woesearchaeota archaeon]
MKHISDIYFYITCFVTGAVILVLEVLGFRLFAPYFGYSVYVSGTLIGVVLLFLSIGYYVGGKLADKYPDEKVMYHLILWSAVYLVGMFVLYKPMFSLFQQLGLMTGTVVSTFVLYGVPMTLLSMVSPYLIKMLSKKDRMGSIAGTIFSVSTLGSITGTFLATFLLIPFWGSNKTFALCIILLIFVSVAGLAMIKTKFLLFGLVLCLLMVPQYSAAEPGLIDETESFYNLIRIYEHNGERSMMLNSPRWRQSYMPDLESLGHTYREYFNLAPYITDVDNVLVLGMSAGASVHELRHFFDLDIDAVEIDPVVVEMAKEHFGIEESAKLVIYAEDAKTYLTRTDKLYDFVEIDLFQGGPEIPFYVATKEFFTQVYDSMTDDGVVMMNIIGGVRDPKTNMLSLSIANTFFVVFPSVYLMDMEGNTMLVATKSKTNIEDIRDSLLEVDIEVLQQFAAEMSAGLERFEHDGSAIVLTDDRAPLAYITYQVLKGYE